jgi:hypothetical protein
VLVRDVHIDRCRGCNGETRDRHVAGIGTCSYATRDPGWRSFSDPVKLCWDRGHETGGTSPGIPGWGYAGSECNLRLALGMTRLRSAKAYLGDGRHWSAVGHGAGYGIRDTGGCGGIELALGARLYWRNWTAGVLLVLLDYGAVLYWMLYHVLNYR